MFRVGIGGEVIDRDHAGQAIMVADVVHMPLQVGNALIEGREVLFVKVRLTSRAAVIF